MTGKPYADAHSAVCDKRTGADLVFDWFSVQVASVSAATTASVITAGVIWKRRFVDDVILPHDTGEYIWRFLNVLIIKSVNRPEKRNSNLKI
ncbi:hypothetical protein KKI24_27380 [bacterium]|nr:hypothetical protein [bacterium]